MSVLHIPIVHAHDVSKQIPREKKIKNVIKQLFYTSAVCALRYEARGKFGEHERCVRVALGYASSNSYASFVLSKLSAYFISR